MLFSSHLLAQNWQPIQSYDADSRHHPITFSNDRYGFVMAGQNASGEYLEDAYRFDAQTESWEQIGNFPGGPRGYAYGVSNNTTAYVGFGKFNSDYPTDWWAYDIPNNQWTQLANFPSAGRSHPALVLVNDKVYVGLGSNTANLDDWWEYDIPSDSWLQKADFDFGVRHHPFYFGIDGVPYVGFGHGNSINGAINIYNDFYKYDAETDSWITLNEFPSEGRVAGTQFSYNGKGYVLSGDGDDHGPLDSGELWEYTPQTDNWVQLESHPGNARWAPGCFLINCDLYFTSGYDRNNQIYFNDLIKFKLGDNCGCTDTTALNFDSDAMFDDFNCCYLAGCTEPTALNYNELACQDDGTCITPQLGCTNPFSENFDSTANVLVANGGAIDNLTYGVGGFHTNDAFDMVFDCVEHVTINSVDVYAQTAFVVEIEILDVNDTQIYSANFFLNEGLNTISIDYDIEVGNDYKIGVIGDNQGLYRNNDVDSGIFPINILDYISITANTTSNPQSYYYYFYNWQLSVICDDVYGCLDTLACNYSNYATISDLSCVYLDGICESCEDGVIIDNDFDNDGICDEFDVISFNCVNNVCIDPMDGSGFYNDLNECEADCSPILESWNCVNNACVDPMDGSGFYDDLNECETDCSQIIKSWRCDNGVCGVLNDGTGEYLSLEECEKQCQDISLIIEKEFSLNIFPNPSYDSFTLEFISHGIIDINLTNLIGEKILGNKLNVNGNYTMFLDLSMYPKGIFNLIIITNNRIFTEKLILQ